MATKKQKLEAQLKDYEERQERLFNAMGKCKDNAQWRSLCRDYNHVGNKICDIKYKLENIRRKKAPNGYADGVFGRGVVMLMN